MPLIRRVPKRGFTNIFRQEIAVVNVRDLAGFEGEVTPETAASNRGWSASGLPVKILGDGEISPRR